MKFIDLIKYTGSQTNTIIFDMTLEVGYQQIPENTLVIVTLRDTSGTYATVSVNRSGSTVTVIHLLGSAFGVLPNFNGEVTLVSSVGGDIIDRGFGVGALVGMGQSNVIGWDTDFNARIDFPHGSVTQHVFNWRDAGDVLTTIDEVEIVDGELAWAKLSSLGDTVSALPHMAKALLAEGGHSAIEILPGAQGSTAFGPITSGVGVPGEQWVKGGILYERLVDMTVSFLDRKDTNYLACFVMMLGESDAFEDNITEQQFTDFTDQFWIDFKSDVTLATGYNMSLVPFVAVGMNDDFLTWINGGTAVEIQASLAGIPDRISRSAYVSMLGQPSLDPFHHNAEAQRNLGRKLFMDGYRSTFTNWTASGETLLGTLIATGNSTANFLSTLSGDILATADATSFFGGNTELDGNILATANAVVDLTVPTVPPIIANWKAGIGITKDGGNKVSEWADSDGNGHTWTQPVGAWQPTDTGTEIQFTAAADTHMSASSGIIDIINSDRFTLIYQYKATSSGLNLFGNAHTFVTPNASDTRFRISDAGGVDDVFGADTNDGLVHTLSAMVDRNQDVKRYTIDGGIELDLTSGISPAPSAATTFDLGKGFGTFNHSDSTALNMYITDAALSEAEVAAIIAGW